MTKYEELSELWAYMVWAMRRAAYSIEDGDPREIRLHWMDEVMDATAEWQDTFEASGFMPYR